MATVSLSDRSRPEPRRGWIQARGPRSKVKLKFYTAPFSQMTGTEVRGRVSPNAYVGLVHNVDHSELFTSVLVPHPEHKDLLV